MAGLDRREFLAAAAGGVAFTALPSELAAGQSGRLSRRAARALRSDVRGRVLLPGGRGYNAARLIYNLRYDGARPAAVVQPRDTRDVAAVVSWANRFDGRVRQVSPDTNEDLYWACRGGGGGNFGIVTSMTFQAHRAKGAAWFFISWPWGAASEAPAAWPRLSPP